MDLRRAVETAEAAAREAGALLLADFHRGEGARGAVDKADADIEAERAIRARLLAAFPHWSYLGEETGRVVAAAGAPVWLVDPNDGTRDYLAGQRGSAVSIGVVDGGRPVLGVVFAYAYPDDRGDLFAWAEGCGPLRRNGSPVAVALPELLTAADVVLASSSADQNPAANLRCVAPARYRTVPSVAHRLALLAAGEASSVSSLFAPGAWDYAAGHALVRAAGGCLLDQDGQEVAYAADGESGSERVLAGSLGVARALVGRAWESVRGREPGGDEHPVRLARGAAVSDSARLSRAQGCLLGQLAGDNLGALVEFQSSEAIAARYPEGPRLLADGGVWEILAGQPTDDSEMALALARSIVATGAYDASVALEAYRRWYRSGPYDVGHTTRAALVGYLMPQSQANGSLMRASPLGIFAHAASTDAAAAWARQDSELTHPHPVCRDGVAAFVVAVARALAGEGREAAYRAALEWARRAAVAPVVESLEAAAGAPPVCDRESQGWVLIALRNAFYELLHAPSLEAGVVDTVRRGGDTDTNAAIAGALLGAVHGREAIPAQWRRMILSCRPHPFCARRPRPLGCWPVDALELAERLLISGSTAAR